MSIPVIDTAPDIITIAGVDHQMPCMVSKVPMAVYQALAQPHWAQRVAPGCRLPDRFGHAVTAPVRRYHPGPPRWPVWHQSG